MMAQYIRSERFWGLGLSVLVLLGIGFWIGQSSSNAPLAAEPAKTSEVAPVSAVAPVNQAAKRVVAYVYNSVPITREEFGDYLISLYGQERLELYVNKRIIEMECAKKGIDVTPQEIDAAIADDCKKINVSHDDYIRTVLKQRYGKSLTEWRNDVMRPRLLLAKLCRDQIQVDEEDLKRMYENRYGMKAKCKIILWPKDQRNIAEKMYGTLRGPVDGADPKVAEAAWDSVATKQPDPTLAGRAGEIEPIGRFSGPESEKVEEIAFNLKVGEVSKIIELPIGFLVVKRVGTVEPVKGIDFEKAKADLRKEVIDRKIDKEIPKYFAGIKKEADPKILMAKP